MSDARPAGIADLTRLFINIALLRRGPEDVPASALLLVLTIVAYVLLTLILGAALPLAVDTRMAVIATDCFVALLWYWVVLRVAGRPERFLQTSTAVFGIQVVIAPLFGVMRWLMLTYKDNPDWQLPAMALMFVVSIWTLTVNARVLRSATEWRTGFCVALVVLQGAIGLVLTLLMFPGDTPAAATG